MAKYYTISHILSIEEKLTNNQKNTSIFWEKFGNQPGNIVNKGQLPPWGYLGFVMNAGAGVSAKLKPPPTCPPPRCYTIAIENFIVDGNAEVKVYSPDDLNNEVEKWQAYPVDGNSGLFAFIADGSVGNLNYPVSIELNKDGVKSTVIFESDLDTLV